MLTFNREQYLNEMRTLCTKAKVGLRAKYPKAVIYTINIWTDPISKDPKAAVSTVSFDTEQSSAQEIAFLNERAAAVRERLLASGDAEGVTRWPDQVGRIRDAADFAYPGIAVIFHYLSTPDWKQAPEGQRWDVLEPALLEAGELARREFADLRLHPEAELSVNDRDNECAHTWRIGASAGTT